MSRKKMESTIMAKMFLILPVLLLVAVLGASRGLDLGIQTPDVVLQDVDGTEFSMANMQGKIVIVVFWRAGQERSANALAILQSIYAKYKEEGVEVLAINTNKGEPEAITKMKELKQLTFPMLLDSQEQAYSDYEVKVTPSTFVIDKIGKLSYYYPGYRDDFLHQVSGRVEVLLGKKTLEELQAELQPVERVEISESEKKAKRYLKMGDRLLEKGMEKNAMLQYRKAIREKPDLFEAHLYLGDIYLDQKKMEDADSSFRKAIELKQRSSVAHAGLADVLFSQGKLEESVKMLGIALKLNPKLARAHYRLGRVHEEQGQMEDALKEYKVALRILLKIKKEISVPSLEILETNEEEAKLDRENPSSSP